MSVFDPEEFLKARPLPTANDVLFQSGEDWWNNACLHFAPDGWLTYALGYKEAADRLVAQLLEERRRQDLLVYPVVFLYRQYLELAIKGLIRQGQALLDIPAKLPASHRIDQLWVDCSKLLTRISPGDSLEEQRQIGRLLREFSEVDPTSTAFRYPVDTAGNRSASGIRHINLRNVRDVIGKISVILDGACAQLDHYQSCVPDS
jgi:hypothetical protein